jgi:hypothetical protein
MNKTTESTLFTQPISRRTYYWLLFLSPVGALYLYLNSRRTQNAVVEK